MQGSDPARVFRRFMIIEYPFVGEKGILLPTIYFSYYLFFRIYLLFFKLTKMVYIIHNIYNYKSTYIIISNAVVAYSCFKNKLQFSWVSLKDMYNTSCSFDILFNFTHFFHHLLNFLYPYHLRLRSYAYSLKAKDGRLRLSFIFVVPPAYTFVLG